MKVTFDSNSFRKVLNPNLLKIETDRNAYKLILDNIQKNNIEPYFSSAMFIYEEAPRKYRADHIAKRRVNTDMTWGKGKNGSIRGTFSFEPDNETSTPLSPYSLKRLSDALSLGFKMIHVPRLGMPIPIEISKLLKQNNDKSYSEFMNKCELKSKVLEVMEQQNVGPYAYMRLKEKIRNKSGTASQTNAYFNDRRFLNENEQKSLGAVMAEFSDGDLIAAHIGEGLDLICTEDFGGGHPTKSVFSSDHRKWLTEKFNCHFITPLELHKKISKQDSC